MQGNHGPLPQRAGAEAITRLPSFIPGVDPEDDLGRLYEDTELPTESVTDHAAIRTEDRPYG